MIRGRDTRHPDHPIADLFVDRWSPRAMSGEEIPEKDLMTLLEAARWAPSSNNAQPWRMLYARRSSRHWPTFLGLLSERSQSWARHAGALVLFVSKTTHDDGRPSITHVFDTGAAWQNLALQGWLKGYAIHGMQSFDYERARTELEIPEGFHVNAMAAIGLPGDTSALPEDLRAREVPSQRRGLAGTICEGPFRL